MHHQPTESLFVLRYKCCNVPTGSEVSPQGVKEGHCSTCGKSFLSVSSKPHNLNNVSGAAEKNDEAPRRPSENLQRAILQNPQHSFHLLPRPTMGHQVTGKLGKPTTLAQKSILARKRTRSEWFFDPLRWRIAGSPKCASYILIFLFAISGNSVRTDMLFNKNYKLNPCQRHEKPSFREGKAFRINDKGGVSGMITG